MQRSLTYQNTLKYALWSILYWGYISLGSIYLLLPPLLAPLFFFFHKSLRTNDSALLFFVVVDIFVLEAQKGFMALTLLIYFLLLERFVVPELEQNINSRRLRHFITVFLTYVGFILFSALLAQIFLLPALQPSLHIVYYIFIEFLIVSVIA